MAIQEIMFGYSLSSDYRRRTFVETGSEPPEYGSVKLPATDLSREGREACVEISPDHRSRYSHPLSRCRPVQGMVPALQIYLGCLDCIPTQAEIEQILVRLLAEHQDRKRKEQEKLDSFRREVESVLAPLEALADSRVLEASLPSSPIRYGWDDLVPDLVQRWTAVKARWERVELENAIATLSPIENLSDDEAAKFPYPHNSYDIQRRSITQAFSGNEALLRRAQELIRRLSCAREAVEEARKEAQAAAREEEKRLWIQEFGSERLKKAYSGGYECTRLYVTERAEKEFPDFILDFKKLLEWRRRANPTEKALTLLDQYPDGKIVWVTSRHDHDHDSDEHAYYDGEEAFVLTFDYLGKYTLLKYLGDPREA